jgi:hypothetical protein
MAALPVILPTARIFTGPGDPLFECDRIWFVTGAGRHYGIVHTPRAWRFIMGREGDDQKDLALLTHALAQSNKGT